MMTNTVFHHSCPGCFNINKMRIFGVMIVDIGSGNAIKCKKVARQRALLESINKFKQFKSNNLWIFNNSGDIKSGSEWALYLLYVMILMNRFLIFTRCW